MFLRTLVLTAIVALLGPTAAFAQDATNAPMPMSSPMMGHHVKGGHMKGKHHRHHRHHKHCRDASGKFVKCTKGMSGSKMMTPSSNAGTVH